jgi:glyoxylase-like metal-dependent hydrolase (beta-lactamase superfamily II)
MLVRIVSAMNPAITNAKLTLQIAATAQRAHRTKVMDPGCPLGGSANVVDKLSFRVFLRGDFRQDAIMRIHHLNCGSMNPPMVSRDIVCHVLLLETDEGLVLVDSGLGRKDFTHPKRMGPVRFLLRPVRDNALTAAAQIEAMGHSTADVTHIVLTHMDFDHIGGIADFPQAVIHTTAAEHDWAIGHPDFASKQRYSSRQWDHSPRFETHAGPGDPWVHGLSGVPVLPGVTYLPMPGHTKGHAAVAISTGSTGGGAEELLIHAGDAVFDASSYAETSPTGTPLTKVGMLRAFEKVMAYDRKRVVDNHATLTRLNFVDGVTVVNAHDKRILDDLISR